MYHIIFISSSVDGHLGCFQGQSFFCLFVRLLDSEHLPSASSLSKGLYACNDYHSVKHNGSKGMHGRHWGGKCKQTDEAYKLGKEGLRAVKFLGPGQCHPRR